jgi:hypothetical protein
VRSPRVIETRFSSWPRVPETPRTQLRPLRHNLTVHSSSLSHSMFVMTTSAVGGASNRFTARPMRVGRKEAMPARYHAGLAGAASGCPISPQGEVALQRSAIRPNHRGDCDRRSEVDPRGGLPVVGGRCHNTPTRPETTGRSQSSSTADFEASAPSLPFAAERFTLATVKRLIMQRSLRPITTDRVCPVTSRGQRGIAAVAVGPTGSAGHRPRRS